MGGMNLMFHIGSALALVLLVYLALEFKRQRDLMRELMSGARKSEGKARVYVETPAALLARLAKALGFETQGESPKGLAPRRIDPRPLVELFLDAGIDLLKWADGGTLEIHCKGSSKASDVLQKQLVDALGGDVRVKIMGVGK